MKILFLIIVLQLIITGIVIFVLKLCLNKELEKAALEKFSSLKILSEIKEINIYYFGALSAKLKEELISVAKRKFENAEIIFKQNQTLKGGLIIIIADDIYDFSVASRLKNFWS